jgi:hypothetical protein
MTAPPCSAHPRPAGNRASHWQGPAAGPYHRLWGLLEGVGEVVPLKGDSYRTKNRREQLASTTVKN